MCTVFDTSQSKSLTKYQKILWGYSFGCKNMLNFFCLTMKFHNCYHNNVYQVYRSLGNLQGSILKHLFGCGITGKLIHWSFLLQALLWIFKNSIRYFQAARKFRSKWLKKLLNWLWIIWNYLVRLLDYTFLNIPAKLCDYQYRIPFFTLTLSLFGFLLSEFEAKVHFE